MKTIKKLLPAICVILMLIGVYQMYRNADTTFFIIGLCVAFIDVLTEKEPFN